MKLSGFKVNPVSVKRALGILGPNVKSELKSTFTALGALGTLVFGAAGGGMFHHFRTSTSTADIPALMRQCCPHLSLDTDAEFMLGELWGLAEFGLIRLEPIVRICHGYQSILLIRQRAMVAASSKDENAIHAIDLELAQQVFTKSTEVNRWLSHIPVELQVIGDVDIQSTVDQLRSACDELVDEVATYQTNVLSFGWDG